MVSRREGRSGSAWKAYPELLTFISSVGQKLEKLTWNFSRYEGEIFRRPCNLESVNFAALDFCVAAVSLRDWVKIEVLRFARANPAIDLPQEESSFYSLIKARIRWQHVIEAVANASKHGTYDDRQFEGGVVQPTQMIPPIVDELTESPVDLTDVSWYDLLIQQRGSDEATPGYVAFGEALEDWETLINELISLGAVREQ